MSLAWLGPSARGSADVHQIWPCLPARDNAARPLATLGWGLVFAAIASERARGVDSEGATALPVWLIRACDDPGLLFPLLPAKSISGHLGAVVAVIVAIRQDVIRSWGVGIFLVRCEGPFAL